MSRALGTDHRSLSSGSQLAVSPAPAGLRRRWLKTLIEIRALVFEEPEARQRGGPEGKVEVVGHNIAHPVLRTGFTLRTRLSRASR